MEIDISNFSENEMVSLLCSVIESQQRTKKSLEGQLNGIENDKTELENQVNDLKTDKTELENQVNDLKTDKTELENQVDDLKTDKTELEKSIKTLKNQVNVLKTNKTELEKTVESLRGQVNNLETKIYREKLKHFIWALEQKHEELNSKWKEFIHGIRSGIEMSNNSDDCLKDSIYKLQAKNSWLTKLCSLYWWSMESNVRNYVPAQFCEESFFHKSFDDFLLFMKSQDFQVNMPNPDFSSNMQNYKADYDEKNTWVDDLFPEYKPKIFVLCEICTLSINDQDGKCIGFGG